MTDHSSYRSAPVKKKCQHTWVWRSFFVASADLDDELRCSTCHERASFYVTLRARWYGAPDEETGRTSFGLPSFWTGAFLLGAMWVLCSFLLWVVSRSTS
jgi:hypothetical protein